jgi:beta-glucosidase
MKSWTGRARLEGRLVVDITARVQYLLRTPMRLSWLVSLFLAASGLLGLGLLPACESGGGTPTVKGTAGPLVAAGPTSAPPSPPTTVEGRVDDIVRQMTLDEKIDYIGGDRAFYIRGIPRLGVPEIKMSDGPAGCRNWGPSTAYPAPLALAATFDAKLAERVGQSIGRDCRARGVHILLAPGVNIHRSPLGGRNFEYLGEDPLLAGKTAAGFIRGVQGEGVLATVKHFAGNNQEWDRNGVSSEIDERTLREIYLPAFERAVHEGGVSAVMTAYNLLNGTYCSHSEWLIHEVLEKEWGFRGFVMSDWGAVHDTIGAVAGGCDLEMPSGKYMNRGSLGPLLSEHRIDATTIDEKVRRILRGVVGAGFLDRPQQKGDVPLDDPASAAVALDSARRSLVLLKNATGLLPLDRTRIQHIAVIGPNADPAIVGGYGSAFVTPFHTVSLLAGVKQAASGATVDYSPGVRQPSEFALLGRACFDGPVKQSVFIGRELAGDPVATTTVDRIDYRPEGSLPAPPAPGVASENFSVRWTGEVAVKVAGPYRLITNTDDGVRVFVDEKKQIDDWVSHATKTNAVTMRLAPGRHGVVVEYFQGTGGAVAQFGFGPETGPGVFDGSAEVSAMARRADVVVVSIGFGQDADSNSVHTAFPGRWPPAWARQAGLVEAEDSDRPFELPPAQLETVRLAVTANPRTIVVVNAGGAVDLQKFVDKVPALLWAWYPGQEGGRAVAEVLFGDVSPSGKLPVTFAKRYSDYPSAPYYHLNQSGKTPYTEGIFVGYRGFEASHVAPQFPFGYGLSYTQFEYSDLRTIPAPDGSATVALTVKNVGERDGDESAQVYVAPPKSSVSRPPKELKGYARVSLARGEAKQVSVTLEPRAFAFWDDRAKEWTIEPGAYQVLVGASSTDIRAHGTIEVPARVLSP